MQAMQIARSIVENVARGTEVVQKNETVDILWSGKLGAHSLYITQLNVCGDMAFRQRWREVGTLARAIIQRSAIE